jgi:hypothetical protein
LRRVGIEVEIVANNKTVQGLVSEENGKVAQNLVAGVVGLFIWPIWLGMDFQGAAGKEKAALQSRQEYLTTLALQRNCARAPARSVAAVPPPRSRLHQRRHPNQRLVSVP